METGHAESVISIVVVLVVVGAAATNAAVVVNRKFAIYRVKTSHSH
jgi:hypothetical protein